MKPSFFKRYEAGISLFFLLLAFAAAFALRWASYYNTKLSSSQLPERAAVLFLLLLTVFGIKNLWVDRRWWMDATTTLDAMLAKINHLRASGQWDRSKALEFVTQNAPHDSIQEKLQTMVQEAETRRDASLVLQTGAVGAMQKHYFVAKTLLIFGLAGTMAGLGTMPLGPIAEAVGPGKAPEFIEAVQAATATISAAVLPSILATLATVLLSCLRHFKLAPVQHKCHEHFRNLVLHHLLPVIMVGSNSGVSLTEVSRKVEGAAEEIHQLFKKLSASLDQITTVVNGFPIALEAATKALELTSAKLLNSGDQLQTDLKTGGSEAAALLIAGGTSARNLMETGGSEAGASLIAGGNSARDSMKIGGSKAETSLITGGSSARDSLVAGGQTAHQSLAAGAKAVSETSDKLHLELEGNVTALQESKKQVTEAAKEAGEFLTTGGKAAGELLSQGAKTAEADLLKAKAALLGIGELVRDELKQGATTASDSLKEGGKTASDSLTQGATTAEADIMKARKALEEVGSVVRDGLKQGADAAADILKVAGKDASDALTQGGKTAQADLVNAGGQVKEAGLAAGKEIRAGAASAAESLVSGGNAASSAMAAGGSTAGEKMAGGGTTAGRAMAEGGDAASKELMTGGKEARTELHEGGQTVKAAGSHVQSDLKAGVQDFTEGASLLKSSMEPTGPLFAAFNSAREQADSIKTDITVLRDELTERHQQAAILRDQSLARRKSKAESESAAPDQEAKSKLPWLTNWIASLFRKSKK